MSETKSCPTPSACACSPSASTSTSTSASAATPAAASTGAAGGIQNGKGDAPRNISKRFRSNYDGIKWSSGGKNRREGARFVKAY